MFEIFHKLHETFGAFSLACSDILFQCIFRNNFITRVVISVLENNFIDSPKLF